MKTLFFSAALLVSFSLPLLAANAPKSLDDADDLYFTSECEFRNFAMDYTGPQPEYLKEGLYQLFLKSDAEGGGSYQTAWAGERPQPKVTEDDWSVVELQTLSKKLLSRRVSPPDCGEGKGTYAEVTTTRIKTEMRVTRVSKLASFLELSTGSRLHFDCTNTKTIRNKLCE